METGLTQDVLETVALFAFSCWLFYKWSKKHNLRFLFNTILVILLIPSRWPFFCPVLLSFSLMSFCGAVFIFIEGYRKKQSKEQSLTYFYVLLFLIFGIAFLAVL
jgi:hypothetical protein